MFGEYQYLCRNKLLKATLKMWCILLADLAIGTRRTDLAKLQGLIVLNTRRNFH